MVDINEKVEPDNSELIAEIDAKMRLLESLIQYGDDLMMLYKWRKELGDKDEPSL